MLVTRSSPSRSFTLPLPAELLVRIFELATDNPTRNIAHFVDLPPFESSLPSEIEDQCDDALRTKYAIATASPVFRDICAEFFFEDIRVRYGSETLADVLEKCSPVGGMTPGAYVKRAVLFPGMSSDEVSQRILRNCPALRAIFRPRVSNSETSDNDVRLSDQEIPLRSLQRVDWSSSPCDDPPHVAKIPTSVWSSEALRTLSVGVNEWSRFTAMQETETTEILSHINTLRVRSLDAFGVPGQQLFTLKLPRLNRIVLDQPDSMYALFSIYQYGSQIRTMEFGSHSGFRQHDYISVLLVYCPNATDLYVPIFSMHPTRKNQEGHQSSSNKINHICMSAVEGLDSPLSEETRWAYLMQHLDTFFGPWSRFVELKKVTLFGHEWQELLKDSRCISAFNLLKDSGVRLESNDLVVRNQLEAFGSHRQET